MTTLATQASALKKQVKKIESKEACELAILKECGGYELNKAKTGLEGNLRALNNAEADLRIKFRLLPPPAFSQLLRCFLYVRTMPKVV
jgi:hypothetical protein